MFALLALVTLLAGTSPSPPDTGALPEPNPKFDEVFGDAADYRRLVDEFVAVTAAMQSTRDAFSRAIQDALLQLRAAGARRCPDGAVETFAGALALGQRYLREGRALARATERIRQLDRLGETAGLTPDYRAKVERAVIQYGALVTGYREMKVAAHDQLGAELQHAGCDMSQLAKAGGRVDDWPSAPPSTLQAPAVEVPLQTPPTPRRVAKADPLDVAPQSRGEGILIHVDNTRCQSGTRVVLDGSPLGEVPAATRGAFETTPGPHELCLLTERAKKCGEAGTIRRSYLHDGWTIELRCQ